MTILAIQIRIINGQVWRQYATNQGWGRRGYDRTCESCIETVSQRESEHAGWFYLGGKGDFQTRRLCRQCANRLAQISEDEILEVNEET